MDKFFNYLVFLCFIYLLNFSFKKNRSIFSPSNFFILAWFINYLFLMFFVRDYKLYFEGSVFILLMCCIVFMFGNIGLDIRINKYINKNIEITQLISKLKYIGLLASILGFLTYPLMIMDVNGDVLKMVDLSYIKKVGLVLSYLRYRLGYSFPFYIQFLLGMNYFACLVCGGYFAYLYKLRKFLMSLFYLLCLVTSILVALITTEKAIIIYSLVLFLSSFFATYNTISIMEFKLSKRNIVLVISTSCLIFLLFIYIQMSRYGFSDYEGLVYVVEKLKIYVFGHISAFSIWFKEHAGFYQVGYGRYTFAGIYSMLNISERDPGIFVDYVKVSNSPAYTNVYTVFRSLITDFTITGTCVILSIISYIAGLAYRNSKMSIILYLYLIVFYSFTLTSFLSSFMNYNTIIGAFGMYLITFMILIIINQKNTYIR